MSDIEDEFLLAVERGETDTLKQFLKTKSYTKLNINCRDPLDRDALIIAIDNQNLDIIKLLLDETEIRVGNALLYAIQDNFVEAVELLLDHSSSTERQQQANHGADGLYSEQNCFFSCDMTPLMLAAQKNNLEIIKLLLDRRVSPIPNPHDPRCGCNACSLARNDDCLKHSRARINAYKALASPSLIALSSPDPLATAFEMSAKLENLAKMEPEYKEDYMRLRAQCQSFATKLMDYTRTSRELEILLNFDGNLHSELDDRTATDDDEDDRDEGGDSDVDSDNDRANGSDNYGDTEMRLRKRHTMGCRSRGKLSSKRNGTRLARLKLAIQCKQKTFCAHPNIQELLATMWYENLPGFRRKNILKQTFQILCIGLMFPVYSIAYLIAPQSQFGSYIKKPFIKFICHSASYITFIIVLILASQRVEAFYEWSSVLSLFVGEHGSYFDHQQQHLEQQLHQQQQQQQQGIHTDSLGANNFTLWHQAINSPPTGGYSDDSEINSLAALYRHTMGQAATSGSSTARGLDSLSKIFEQLPASSKKRGTVPSPIESIILIWVLSLIWAELKQIRALGINYYKDDMWNILDSIASGCYIGTIILRVVSYAQSDGKSLEVAREHWHAYDPTLLSEGLFATATIFSALKLIYIFSVNPYLGPLQISLGRMIIDILRFSWIYMLVLFAFACGMNQLLWYYADLERHQCLNVTNYNLAQYYKSKHNLIESSTLNTLDSPPSSAQVAAAAATTTTTITGDLVTPSPLPVVTSLLLNATTAALMNATTASLMNATATALVDATSTALMNATVSITNATIANDTTTITTTITTTTTTTTTPEPVTSSSLNNENVNNLANMTDENLMESAFSASFEDNSYLPPVTIDDSCKTWRHFSNVFESSQTLFWANFGLVDLENFDLTGIRQYTRFWALLMFGCYCFINVIVVLNLLIAMMNHSYVKISKRSDVEWKFARTRLWVSYFENGSTVPAPFNIIPSFKSAKYLAKAIGRQLRRLYHDARSLVGYQSSAASGTAARAYKKAPLKGDSSGCSSNRSNDKNKDNNSNVNNRRNNVEKLQMSVILCGGDKSSDNILTLTNRHKMRYMNQEAELNYDIVIKSLVRRYLVGEQLQLEKRSGLTEAKLKRWSKLNVFK